MKNIKKELFKKKIPQYRKNPILFFNEVLNFYPDEWQKAAAEDIANYPKVTIRSGQGVGKTGLEAAVALWFLTCFPFARVVATAPTRQQLNDVLWAEISKWQSKSPLLKKLLKWTKTRIYVIGQEERWFAVARTATKPENMQGFHEENMLFIVDEASGVADDIMEAILGTLSGENNKLLLCGNPNKASGTFYDSHNIDKEMYRCHKVSSLDSQRTNKENIQALIKKFGKDSNVVRVRVFGEFPIDEDDVFITSAAVSNSLATEMIEDIQTVDIGVDVARFGDDNSVIAIKVNNKILPLKVYHGNDTTQIAEKTVYFARQLKARYGNVKKIYCKIDDTGVGGGVTDQIRKIQRVDGNLDWLSVIPVNFAISVNHPYYVDFATLLWGILKEKMEEKEVQIPNDSDLIGELTSRRKQFSATGKIKIEPKKEMKERGLCSPDRSDAVALAVYPIFEDKQKKRKEGGKRR